MNAFESYLNGGHERVFGWLNQRSAQVIANLCSAQSRAGLTGALGEIGVHHGKLFILLALAAQPGEKTFAIDVFDMQELNTDQSGKGDRAIFERHMSRNGLDPAQTVILAKSSLDLTAQELVNLTGPIRMMSIDGGHTEECVLNDLRIADEALAEHGVIIIDDVFNGTWPAVITGYAKYLLESPGTVPFAISPNKVFACRPDYVDVYKTILRERLGRIFDRSDQLFGFAVDTYGSQVPLGYLQRAKRKFRHLTGSL